MANLCVVVTQADGDVLVKVYTREDFIKELNKEYWGPNPQFVKDWEELHTETFGSLANQLGDKILVLPYQILAPELVTKVSQWKLP